MEIHFLGRHLSVWRSVESIKQAYKSNEVEMMSFE